MKKGKALFYNLMGFSIPFFAVRFLVMKYTGIQGIWIPLTAFVAGTILAPKFQTIMTPQGEKIFMKWLFMSGVKEVK